MRTGASCRDVVADLLLERSLAVALAESCTGGLLAARLTAVPGVSAVLERTIVSYANRGKVDALGVAPALLERHGAVSEEVAAAMAKGAMTVARTDIGVAITGIAGPEGGTSEKPFGLVFVAICGAAGTRVRRNLLPGGRERVRLQATQLALEMLRRGLLGASGAVTEDESIRAFIALELDPRLRAALGKARAAACAHDSDRSASCARKAFT